MDNSLGATVTLTIPYLDYILGLKDNSVVEDVKFEGEFISYDTSTAATWASRSEKIKRSSYDK